jgi:alkylation response protein AidB-like acyl-CoA dehydrogenase
MDLSLTEEQLLIKRSAEKFFTENLSFEQRTKILKSKNNIAKDLIDKSMQLGWYSLPFDQKYGGLNGKVTDVMTIIETFGENLHIDPYIFSLLLPGKIIESFCNEKQAAYYLPKIMQSHSKIVYCFAEPNLRYNFLNLSCEIDTDNNKYLLNGKKILVIGGNSANSILVPAKDKNNNVYIIILNAANKSLLAEKYATIDDFEAVDFEFDNLEVDQEEILIKVNNDDYKKKIEAIIDYVTLACCSEALGIIEKMYLLTLEYVKTREQFGKKIGSFQIVQHRMVDMYIKKEEMRSLNYMAQVSLSNNINSQDTIKSIALNKIFLGTKAKEIAQDSIQLHGGMGVANEMAIGHYFKRLTTICSFFGDADFHYRRYELNDKD